MMLDDVVVWTVLINTPKHLLILKTFQNRLGMRGRIEPLSIKIKNVLFAEQFFTNVIQNVVALSVLESKCLVEVEYLLLVKN